MHSDCLIFETSDGESIPCSAEVVAVELIGEGTIDTEVVRQVASTVLHYFRVDLGREHVSVGEFSEAIARVLSNLGYNCLPPEEPLSIDGNPELN